MFTTFLEGLTAAIPDRWEKLTLTALLIAGALLLTHLWARYLSKGHISAEKRRLHLVWVRNVVWFVVLLVIVAVWASTIAGFALSLAAVAGAMLIVSKELIMCVQGYLYATLVQPFQVGDTIELQQLRGRVIDIDMFATTLAELDDRGRVTGKTAEFPNGLLLTTPLKNVSPTGDYALHFVRIPVPPSAWSRLDLQALEATAVAAAESATQEWREQAETHFRRLSAENFIDYPSGKIKVYWDFSDPKSLVLTVRLACPHRERLQLEQAVFKKTWQSLQPFLNEKA